MWKSDAEMTEEERRRRKLEEALEVKSLRRIISAYLNYPDAAEDDVRRYERSFRMLPPTHKSLLSHLPSKYESLRRCIQINTHFILHMLQAFEPPLDMSLDVNGCDDQHPECSVEPHCHQDRSLSCSHDRLSSEPLVRSMKNEEEQSAGLEHEAEHGEGGFGAPSASSQEAQELQHEAVNSNGNVNSSSFNWLDPSFQLNVPLVDVDKVRCIIRNIVRDWATEGQVERDQCYQPILEELQKLFPSRRKESPPCCLVPGAGLGRLALEISRFGFVCQGNEFSYYMMICSNFILNHSQAVGEWTIYPWIHSNCNSLSDKDQLRAVSIPDILPASSEIEDL